MARHTLRIPQARPRARSQPPPTRVHRQRRRSQRVGQPHDDGLVEFAKPEYRFCPRCGTPLVDQMEHAELRPTCPKCGFVVYYNPVPAVGAVIVEGDTVLLVKRKYEPRRDMWSLPAGFMNYGERQVDALAREVREETGLEVFSATQLSVEDAADDPRVHALLISFIVDSWEGQPRPGDDASACQWWPIASPPPDVAWRNHTRVLAKAREWLGL